MTRITVPALIAALTESRGSRTIAARILGVTTSAVSRRVYEYDLAEQFPANQHGMPPLTRAERRQRERERLARLERKAPRAPDVRATRPCLGSDCRRLIPMDPRIRLCEACKDRNRIYETRYVEGV